jgi:glutaminyl-tRNA synthetase
LWIDADDFMEVPAPKYYRLSQGKEVRLRYGYFLTCTSVEHAADGSIESIRCTYDPLTAGGQAPDGRKVKATIHWLSALHSVEREVRLYDHLFTDPHPGGHDGVDPLTFLNPHSLTSVTAMVEPALASVEPGSVFQFERLGYFCADSVSPEVFHRTVSLKDEWSRVQKRA